MVFTSTYAGTVYAFDTNTGKQLWSTTAPAGVNSFAAVDADTVLVGAATTGNIKHPQFKLVAYSLSGTKTSARSETPSQPATGTNPPASAKAANAVGVTAGDLYFKLSKRTLAKPGTVTFSVTNAGHIVHDLKIDGKQTPLIQPGKSAEADRLVHQARKVHVPVHDSGPCRRRHEGRLHRPLIWTVRKR